ncbi:MAG: hypothetical protein APF80_07385 [Alphaproteobacteria bacterium BRH_c36]|nr:MAG: hypothetical protein APF80_07385 [Alphaproteobacteria bacterium BRH_c36]
MIRTLIVAMLLFIAGPALAHSESSFLTGPNGGHMIDAGGGAQHWELVAAGNELTLYVTDSAEKPVETAGGKADATVLVGGKTHKVTFTPAGDNTMKATGDFEAKEGMKVIVKTDGVGGESFQARLTPLK